MGQSTHFNSKQVTDDDSFRWKTFDDSGLQLFFQNLDNFTAIMFAGGAALADSFPFVRYLPASLYPIKRKASEHHEVEKKMYEGLYLKAKKAIVEKLPSARPCACDDIVEMQQQEGFSDDFAMYVASTIFEAGSETTASELYGFAQAMLLYPDVQRKAQAEIDALMGEERWPTIDDAPHLPYVRACIKETLRWMPTLILGAAPHALMEDDQYMGYHLPAGAMVMLNVWTIHRDAERYARPEFFSPERYLGDETSSAESCTLPDVSKRDHFSFGAGRRVCPGTHVADNSMFLVMARVLWAFDVKPKQGGRVSRQDEFVQAMSVAPKPFEVEITPRSAKRGETVRREWSEAQTGLDEKGQFLKNPI
jgi:cytochrome P450